MKNLGFPGGSVVKKPPANIEDTERQGFDPWVRKIPWSRKWQRTPVCTWKITRVEQPGGLQFMESHRVGHN